MFDAEEITFIIAEFLSTYSNQNEFMSVARATEAEVDIGAERCLTENSHDDE